MSDKTVLCLACGSFAPEGDRILGSYGVRGVDRMGFTYHRECARMALRRRQDEFEALAGNGQLADEIEALQDALEV